MPSETPKFYLTTPIYYVNARPHIGHAYTTIVADVLARRHRLLGDDTFFLTGTDEHGQKIERSASAAGIPPQAFTDRVSAEFKSLWDRMGLTYDAFIRTTDPRHKRGAQKLFADLYKRGAIYLSAYTGQYCVSEELFVEGPPGTIGPDGKPTETVTEENFFFKLSEYQRPLIDLIESDTFLITPEARKNEVLSFLRGNVTESLRWHAADAQASAPITSQELSSRPEQHNTLPNLSSRPEPQSTLPELSSRPEQHSTPPELSSRPERAARSGETPVFRPEQHSTPPNLPSQPEAQSAAGERPAVPRPQKLAYSALGNPYVPGALRDLSVSRSSFTWGIPVPEPAASATDKKHVMYVWLDALANYMTAIGYGDPDPKAQAAFDRFWPADLHIMAKEITRQHCVYWPAFLLAAGLPLPKAVTAHGWLLFDNSKMSKSKGNIVRTETILDAFGALCPPVPASNGTNGNAAAAEGTNGNATDAGGTNGNDIAAGGTNGKGVASATPQPASPSAALAAEVRPPTSHERDLFATDVLRYFLLREVPFGQDGSFSFEALVTRYNADLANGYGNLVSRVLNLIAKTSNGAIEDCLEANSLVFYQAPRIETPSQPERPEVLGASEGQALGWAVIRISESFAASIERNAPTEALAAVSRAITAVDGFITSRKPWAATATDLSQEGRRSTLYTAAESIRILTALLYPILPYATAKVWQQLGLGDIELAARNGQLTNLEWGGLKPGTRLGSLAPIFPRAEKGLAQLMTDMEEARNATPHTSADLQQQRPEATLKAAATPTPAAPVSHDPTHPAAPPRSGSFDEPAGALPVGGSGAPTANLPTTPGPHTEAQASGPFASPASQMPANAVPGQAAPQIGIDDFMKVELRVAEILVAERIPKADKLLRLEVDLGYERRQILSGIAQWYTPEELIGRRIVIVANLAPRKMRGLESHGMLLAASEGPDGKPILATFGESIALGARVR